MTKDSDGEGGLVLLVVGGMLLVFLLAAVAQHFVPLLVIAAAGAGIFAAVKIAGYLTEQSARQREKDALEREQRRIHQDYVDALALVDRMPSAEAFAQSCDAPYLTKCAEQRLAPLDAPIRARLFERLSQAYRQAVAFPAYLRECSIEIATRKINHVLGNPHIDSELAARGLDIQSMEFIKDAFSTITETPFSGKQEICFLNLLAVLREIPGANIQTLKDLLSGHYGAYQDRLDRLDGDMRHFWEKQFNGRDAIYKSTKEEIGYRLDGMLIKSPMLKAILSSPVTKLDLNAEIAQAKVVIINTSQALLGVDGGCLFGRLFIAMIQQIAERRFLPGARKLPTFCYIDECGDYLKKEAKFAPILNRCRAANIGMILAHQDLAQISADVFSALSNAGIEMVNTYADAPAFARPMRCEPEFLNKPTGQFAAMLRDAHSSPVTIHVPDVDFSRAPRMSQDERRELWAEMHARYCRSAAQESASSGDASPNRDADRAGSAKTENAPDIKRANARDPPPDEADIGPSNDY